MQNSVKEEHENQDQRKKTEMEDATAMTIEFFRAQLLSERSVSIAARQRADELAKRVMELEERLNFVTLQRKKAEKATTEVLAILQNDGISGFSDAFALSSDQEGVLCDSKNGNTSTKEEETYVTSRSKDAEEFSGSELECSSSTSGTLSWKNGRDTQYSLEKKYINQDKRRSSFTSCDGSLPKQCMRKSCYLIRRRERRSAVDEVRDGSSLLRHQENEVASHSGAFSNCFNDSPEISREVLRNEEEKVSLGAPLAGSLEHQREVTNASLYVNGSNGPKDMEREQQAQLIGRYEANENAQREWEEKFRKNNSCIPDSCEPLNRSDITEERDDIRARAADPVETNFFLDRGGKSETAHACCTKGEVAKTQLNGFLLGTHVHIGCLQDQQCSSALANESPTSFSENIEANTKVKNNLLHSPSCSSTGHQSTHTSSNVSESFYTGESSGSRNNLQALMPQETTNGLGGVLEALRKAKLSLDHELNGMPESREVRMIKSSMEPPANSIKAGDTIETPVGRAGVFRVPTNLRIEANFLRSSSRLDLTRNNPGMGDGVAVAGDERYTTNPYSETMSRISSLRSLSNPCLDSGLNLLDSSRYGYPYCTDLMPRMPLNDRLLIPYSSKGPRMSAEAQYSFHDDQINRPNMHKW